jgi:hypothetical protein
MEFTTLWPTELATDVDAHALAVHAVAKTPGDSYPSPHAVHTSLSVSCE